MELCCKVLIFGEGYACVCVCCVLKIFFFFFSLWGGGRSASLICCGGLFLFGRNEKWIFNF